MADRRGKTCYGEYLSGKARCRPCDATCYRCTGPGDTDCISCPPNRYFDDGCCVNRCPAGKYVSGGRCHLCHHTCDTCSDGSPSNCTACENDKFGVERYLFKSECREACPEGHFPSQERICKACGENCVVCTGVDRCIECSPSYYPLEGVCTKLECGEGEVEDVDDEDCVTCEEGCKKCLQENPRKCLSCQEGFYKFGFRCYKNCPESTYNDQDSMTCEKCDDNCVTCADAVCYWCKENFFLSDDTCVERCEEGFYGDDESQACEPCHRGCKTCRGPNYYDCTACEENAQLQDGECVVAERLCSENTFLNSEEECEPCPPSCASCVGAESCSTCKKGSFLTPQQQCADACPNGSFANAASGRCEDCPAACARCHNGTFCLRCHAEPETHFYLQDGQCVAHCQRGYVDSVQGVCQRCVPRCASCEGGATQCSSCLDPFVLYRKKCLERCPPAHFPKAGECHLCPTACHQCTEGGLCSECIENFFLHERSCVARCPAGFHADAELGECLPCHRLCDSCSGPERDDCIACKNPDAVRHNGECLSKCPSSTFQDGKECRDCDGSCLTCSGPEADDCGSCRPDMRKNKLGFCVFFAECPLRSYKDRDGGCKACHSSCRRCTGPGEHRCLSCGDGRFLLEQTCVDRCPDGFHGDGERRLCRECHGRQGADCLACQPHLFRHGEACVESCGRRHYSNVTSMTCGRCDPACDECRGPAADQCLSCADALFFVRSSGRCYFTCPENFYGDTRARTCEKCDVTCEKCKERGPLNCESCYSGYELAGGICRSLCVPGHFAASVSPGLRCEPCDESCVDCRGPGPRNCTACPALRLLAPDGRCLSCCGDDEDDGSPVPWECCNCTESSDQCVLGVNFELQAGEESAGRPALFVVTSVLLLLGVGGAVFLFLHVRSKEAPKAKPAGYEKLSDGYGGPVTSSRSDRLVDPSDRAEEEDEDEDIVYMGQDGTVYRKFKYGLLEDEDDELEYDDESYSFR